MSTPETSAAVKESRKSDLLQGDVLQVAARQLALGQEGLVLVLRRLVLGARRHHDERLHGDHCRGPAGGAGLLDHEQYEYENEEPDEGGGGSEDEPQPSHTLAGVVTVSQAAQRTGAQDDRGDTDEGDEDQ